MSHEDEPRPSARPRGTPERRKALAAVVALACLAGASLRAASAPMSPTQELAAFLGLPCAGAGGACRPARQKLAGVARERVTGRPRLLAFTSEDCPTCAGMKPVLEQARRGCGEQDAVTIEDDTEAGMNVAEGYDVSRLPSFVAIDAGGHEVTRLSGVQPLDRLQQAIEEARGFRCASVDRPADTKPM